MNKYHKMPIKMLLARLACVGVIALGGLSPPVHATTYIPVNQNEYEQNGSKIIVQKYVEAPDVDPNDLIREPFEFQGYYYELKSIVKDEKTGQDMKFVSKEVTMDLAAKSETTALYEILPQLEATIPYDEEGYVGELALNSESIKMAPAGTTTSSSTRSITRTFTSQYNDDSIIPKTITADGATWYFASRTWSGGTNMNDASLPSSYTATAVYTRNVSSTTNTGYVATMKYEGLVESTNLTSVAYEIVYSGVPLYPELPEEDLSTEESTAVTPTKPSFWENVTSYWGSVFSHLNIDNATETDGSWSSKLTTTAMRIGTLLLGIALGVIALIVLWKVIKLLAKNNNFKSTKAIVMARDEFSGIEKKIQKARISVKRPTITINYAKAPQSKHFSVVLKPEVAEQFSGRRITINIGKDVRTHLVSQSHNNDYVIPIEWDG